MKFCAVFAAIVAVAIARPNAVPALISPSPVVVGPIAPGSSALVQVIINVNNEQQVADVITPTPVLPGLVPEPVQVVEEPDNTVDPIQVLPLPNPDVNPIDIIAVNPVDTESHPQHLPVDDIEEYPYEHNPDWDLPIFVVVPDRQN